MKAGYIQFDVSHNKDENLKYIMQATRNFHGDLVVLPELCMCGYLFQDRDSLWAIVEEVPVGPSTQAMTKLSEECDCVIVFGLAEKEGDFVYNTAVVVGSGKYLGKYRKVECDLSRVNLSFHTKSETRIRERLNTQCIYGAAAWKNVSSGLLLSCC